MYANESKGEKFPTAMHQCNGSSVTGIMTGPYIEQIYPEYLTDPNLFVCPSSAVLSQDDMYYIDGNGNKSCILEIDPEGDGVANDDHWWPFIYCYKYWGWAFDRSNMDSEPSTPISICPKPLPAGIDGSTPGPWQVMEVWLWSQTAPVPDATRSNLAAFFAVADADAQGTLTGTTYRLREGIERFTISDINNPAASAKAQSELAVMWDTISLTPKDFSHVPGGANVLYMDGHVAFHKYPQNDAPVNLAFAIVGYIDASE